MKRCTFAEINQFFNMREKPLLDQAITLTLADSTSQFRDAPREGAEEKIQLVSKIVSS